MPETDQLLPSTNGYYDLPKNKDGSIDVIRRRAYLQSLSTARREHSVKQIPPPLATDLSLNSTRISTPFGPRQVPAGFSREREGGRAVSIEDTRHKLPASDDTADVQNETRQVVCWEW
jgi:hypothetical protein